MHFTDYVDLLMQRTLQYCKSSADDDKPALPTVPPPLASTYVHPDIINHYFHATKNNYTEQ